MKLASTLEVKRFETLLRSDLFGGYTRRHAELEDGHTLPSIAVDNVKEAAHGLARRFKQRVSLKNAAVRIIPVTSALVETVGGKLLGILAKAFGDSFAHLLQNDRRVVIYSFHEVFSRIFEQRLLRVRHLLDQEKKGNR